VDDDELLAPAGRGREPRPERVGAAAAGDRVAIADLDQDADRSAKGRKRRARYRLGREDAVDGAYSGQVPPAGQRCVVEGEAGTVGISGDDDGKPKSGQMFEAVLEPAAKRLDARSPRLKSRLTRYGVRVSVPLVVAK
jgi:hypothetical protein